MTYRVIAARVSQKFQLDRRLRRHPARRVSRHDRHGRPRLKIKQANVSKLEQRSDIWMHRRIDTRAVARRKSHQTSFGRRCLLEALLSKSERLDAFYLANVDLDSARGRQREGKIALLPGIGTQRGLKVAIMQGFQPVFE